jgi:ABC-type dipeptide/oligopeptide/nickel transport system ATPase component
MAPLLEVEDLRTDIRLRTATVHALDGVSLTVEAGECLGIVGESGWGETMTALSIMQLLPRAATLWAAASRLGARKSPPWTTEGCARSGATRSA